MSERESDMVGVILGGGTGSRLKPLTEVTHKHLLPVYKKPMIFYPLERMAESVDECVLVANPEYVSKFDKIIGTEWNGMRVRYAVQNEVGRGIADAIGTAEPFVDNEGIIVMLGDNIFTENPVTEEALSFLRDGEAVIVVKDVPHPELNGVVEFDGSGNIIGIEEKPAVPKSSWVQTGCYLYPADVFERIPALRPSTRGEIEVTDLNNSYREKGRLKAVYYDAEWMDCGTSFDDLLNASITIRRLDGT